MCLILSSADNGNFRLNKRPVKTTLLFNLFC
jgi:hypothetical protein